MYSDDGLVNNLWHEKSLNFRKLGCCAAGGTACYTLLILLLHFVLFLDSFFKAQQWFSGGVLPTAVFHS